MGGTTDDLDHQPRRSEEPPYEVRGLHNSGTWVVLMVDLSRSKAYSLYGDLNQYKIIGAREFVVLDTIEGSRSLQVDTFDLFSVQPMK